MPMARRHPADDAHQLQIFLYKFLPLFCAAREPAVGRCNRPKLLALVHDDHVGHPGRFRPDLRPSGRPARRPRSHLGTRPSPMAAPAIGPGLLAAHLPGSCRVAGAVQGAAVHRRGSAKHMRPLVGAVRPLQPPARQQRVAARIAGFVIFPYSLCLYIIHT